MISSTDLAAMSGDDLVEAMRVRAVRRREIDAECAQLAGEIARRSAPELGYSGLAQQTGARTPQLLVQQTTGLSKAEAGALVRVGTQPEYLAPIDPSRFGIAKADAVSSGLGAPTEAVTADDLLVAAGACGGGDTGLDRRAGGRARALDPR